MNIEGTISKILPENKLKEKLRIIFRILESYRIIPSNRLYEQYILKIYEKRYRVQKGDIVVDAGACFGMNTLKFSKAAGKEGKVVSIEPNESNLIDIRRIIRLHRLKNVVVIPKALWNKKSEMKFYCHSSPGSHSLVDKRNVKEIVEIRVDTMDDILKDLKIDKVDFIKMDIEGAEIEALEGAKETLRNNDVKLAIASYHKINGQPTYKTIIPMMEKIGFKSYFENGISYFEK